MASRLLPVTVGLVALLLGYVPAARGQLSGWQFRTPGDAAYCRFAAADFECVATTDGFWVRFGFVGRSGESVRATKGYAERWRGFRNRSVRLLRFDDEAWTTSDAAVLTCVSRRAGLTCNHFRGLAFRFERDGGHRVYRGPPGSVPDMDPFFRTTTGLWCGNAAGLEPSYMILGCWRIRDGTVVTLSHAQTRTGADVRRNPHGRDYRPRGFPLLRPGETFSLGCRRVTRLYADECGTRRTGTEVFRCHAATTVLRCVNRFGRGFALRARNVSPIS